MTISKIGEVTITQDSIVQFMGIGILVIHSRSGEWCLSLRGISDLEVITTRIEAVM
jgi:hypothetical protein